MKRQRNYYTTLEQHPRYCEELRSFVSDRSYFTVLFQTPEICPLTKRKRWDIYRNVLDKFQPSCSQVLIYDLKTEERRVKRYASYLTEDRGRYRLDLKNRSWADFDSLLYKAGCFSYVAQIRGSIVLECSAPSIPWKDIFTYCHSPVAVNNVSVGCGSSALAYARRHLAEEKVFIFLANKNKGLEDLTIMAERELILRILEESILYCRISPVFSASMGYQEL